MSASVFGTLNDNAMCCLEVDEEWVTILWFHEHWTCLISSDGKNSPLDGSSLCFSSISNTASTRKPLKLVFSSFNVTKRKIQILVKKGNNNEWFGKWGIRIMIQQNTCYDTSSACLGDIRCHGYRRCPDLRLDDFSSRSMKRLTLLTNWRHRRRTWTVSHCFHSIKKHEAGVEKSDITSSHHLRQFMYKENTHRLGLYVPVGLYVLCCSCKMIHAISVCEKIKDTDLNIYNLIKL